MNVIGVSAFFHDSACCLLRDGALVAAVQEERFSRRKNEPRLPVRAFRYCLEMANLTLTDIDIIAYYENPSKKLSRQRWQFADRVLADACSTDVDAPEREIREKFGFEGPVAFFDHHESHAASSFFFSGFHDASILTMDAVGEWATVTYGTGRGATLRVYDHACLPHSPGLFYSAITQYLGFRALSDEYKVMGLAPYGRPLFADRLREVACTDAAGRFRLDASYFDFRGDSHMFASKLATLLGEEARAPESTLRTFHADVARSLQLVFEEIVLAQVAQLRQWSDSENLCMAGGCALNCVANGRVRRESGFRNVFIQPAAGDAGTALGAAALAQVRTLGGSLEVKSLDHLYLGPGFDSQHVHETLSRTGIVHKDLRGYWSELLDAVTEALIAGHVVAWFQGRAEFGPRALGARSLLADPRRPEMRDRLNALVKKREQFRPFAPSILASRAAEHFDLVVDSPFMVETCAVVSPLSLPAIRHIDGSCRPQTVDPRYSARFASLLERFATRTGCPILLNTSFNVRGEPIVLTPEDALRCMASSGVELLAIEEFLVYREPNDTLFADALALEASSTAPRVPEAHHDAAYTFLSPAK